MSGGINDGLDRPPIKCEWCETNMSEIVEDGRRWESCPRLSCFYFSKPKNVRPANKKESP